MRVKRNARVAKGVFVAGDTLLRRVDAPQAHDQRDALVPQADQVVGQRLRGLFVLRAHPVAVGRRHTVYIDHRDPHLVDEGHGIVLRIRGGRKDDPVHTAFVERLDDLQLRFGVIVRAGQQHRVAMLCRLVVDGVDHVDEIAVPDIRDHKSDGLCLGFFQRLGNEVLRVPGGLNGGHHPPARLLAHVLCAVDDMRYGGHGHVGDPGHIGDGDHGRPFDGAILLHAHIPFIWRNVFLFPYKKRVSYLIRSANTLSLPAVLWHYMPKTAAHISQILNNADIVCPLLLEKRFPLILVLS